MVAVEVAAIVGVALGVAVATGVGATPLDEPESLTVFDEGGFVALLLTAMVAGADFTAVGG
jgi:hypothetical protein